MNINECTFESEVLKAKKSGQWPEGVRHHAANCPLCEETMTMAAMMNKISSIGITHPLPSYQLIWLKAQYARKQERLSKLDVVSLVGLLLVGIVGFLGLLLWRFPKVLNGILKTADMPAISWTGLLSHGGSFAVIAGIFIMIWLLTRDSFFAER